MIVVLCQGDTGNSLLLPSLLQLLDNQTNDFIGGRGRRDKELCEREGGKNSIITDIKQLLVIRVWKQNVSS